jgi:alpha-glucosidase
LWIKKVRMCSGGCKILAMGVIIEFFLLWCTVTDVTNRKYVNKKREATTTVKCNCSFRLGSYLLSSGQWSLNDVDEKSNCKMGKILQGHKYAERLKLEDKVLVREMTNNLILSRNILSMLKKRSSMSLTTIKHIDNAHHEYKQPICGPRSEMPQLLKCLSDNIHSFNYKLVSDTEFVSDVFWSHSNFIKLFNIFPIVLVMESTYKSNKYKLPLFEFIDVTSTDVTYFIAIAFMMS